MDQKSKTQLIQQKIKQRIQSRKRIEAKEPSSRIYRQISQKQEQAIQCETNQYQVRNSTKIRPQTSQKVKYESTHSLTTDSSNKNQIDVNSVIVDIFERGQQLQNYLKRRNLDSQDCKARLLSNGLFYTLLQSKLSKIQEDKYQLIAEKQIIRKLQKVHIIENQEKSCLLIQRKISSLLEERLKALQKY